MLRCHLALAAHMILYHFLQESVTLFFQQIIKPYAGTDKHLFYSGQFPQLSQQRNIILMAAGQIRTGLWKQALPGLTYPRLQLFLAGRMPEISGRPSHIMNIPFKIRLPGHPLCFLQQRFMAPHLHDPPLMKSQGTEITAAKAPSAADQ